MRSKFSVVIFVVIIFLRTFVILFVMDRAEPGSSGVKPVTRNELYAIILKSTANNFAKKLEFMESELLNLHGHDDIKKMECKRKLSTIKHEFKRRWMAAQKIKMRFEKNNSDWLKGTVFLPTTGTSPGRPEKPFLQCSERSKRRKTKSLREVDVEELQYATQMKLRDAGKPDASKVMKDLTSSPSRAQKYMKGMKNLRSNVNNQLSVLKALSMFTEAGLTRSQYLIIRETNKSFFPSYKRIQSAKKDCYPKHETCKVTSTTAEVELQELLNHTASRIMMSIQDVVEPYKGTGESFILISKWGCDGSQQNQYKMRFENDTDTDSSIFQSSLVPLQLVSQSEKKIIWQNPTPSSPRYCRPIRLRFVKESNDVTNEEVDYMKQQTDSLCPTVYDSHSIKHKLLFTMVDGKVCNAATHTKYTLRCYICNGTSKDFNDLTKDRAINKENLSFGLSLLHARIRFFETILHVAYKLPVKKWNQRLTAEEQEQVKNTKQEIQNNFKKELGLLVDMPKSNFGNTNDGNTSRRFFENYEISARITGIDVNLIFRFKTILDALCSGHQINIKEFELYALETAKLYVSLYNFYPMSPTVHKVLMHGSEVIKNAILPIGMLSEEAAEARNKHIRSYRLNYARKYSREVCNRDILNRLLLTSDPLITSMRGCIKKSSKPFNKEVINLLLPGDSINENFQDSMSSSDEEL